MRKRPKKPFVSMHRQQTRTAKGKAAAAAAAASTSSSSSAAAGSAQQPLRHSHRGQHPPPAAPAPTTMYISTTGSARRHGAVLHAGDEAGSTCGGGWVYGQVRAGAVVPAGPGGAKQAGRGREREGGRQGRRPDRHADGRRATPQAAPHTVRLSSSQRSSLPSSSWRRPCP